MHQLQCLFIETSLFLVRYLRYNRVRVHTPNLAVPKTFYVSLWLRQYFGMRQEGASIRLRSIQNRS